MEEVEEGVLKVVDDALVGVGYVWGEGACRNRKHMVVVRRKQAIFQKRLAGRDFCQTIWIVTHLQVVYLFLGGGGDLLRGFHRALDSLRGTNLIESLWSSFSCPVSFLLLEYTLCSSNATTPAVASVRKTKKDRNMYRVC